MISKSHFIGQHIEDITQHYDFIKELGRGSYGAVYRVQNKITGNIYACKKMCKKKISNKARFKTEIDLLKATDHPNIVKLFDIFEDKVFLYFIMEEMLGGEFFERLAKRASNKNLYTEKEAARIFKQIIGAVNYLHSHGVSHRDLKPENILFASIAEDSPLKLIDFGLSKVFPQNDKTMTSVVGTTFYMAPEVMKGNYDEKCDIWSCGVMLYIMLCGRPPFYDKDDSQTLKLIESMSYHFNYPEWKNVSAQAKELIQSMLVEADLRPTAQEILEHEWVQDNAPQSTEELLLIDWGHVTKYSQLNVIQKSVINFTAFRLNEEDTRQITKIFNSVDKNCDGVLTLNEIREGLNESTLSLNINPDDLYDLFVQLDVDKNGLINFTEFMAALYDYEKCVSNEHILEAFCSMDVDKSGKLSFEELCEMIKPNDKKDKAYLENLFKSFDKNSDGEIDFDEFINGLDLIPASKKF